MNDQDQEASKAQERAAFKKRMNEQGIHMMRIPTPFLIGPVNSYLIEDDPLTLIDPGPNSGDALESLDLQLHELGHSIEAIELVVLTHHHIDHLGLVDIVARRSGAAVACIDHCVPYLENFEDEAALEDRFAVEIMLRNGISEDVVYALRSVSRAFRNWGSSAKVDRVLKHGELLALRDRKLEIAWRPGHSITDTTFWDADRKLLIAADHLIKRTSSNPLLARPRNEGDQRPQALVSYLASMAETRKLPAKLTLSGHGSPIDDHVALIDERFVMHAERKQKLFDMIVESDQSAHELARATWGNIAVTQAYLTLSEVIGHVDILLNEGLVEEIEHDGVVKFHAVG